MKQRIASMLTVLALCLSLLPATAFAAGSTTRGVNDEASVTANGTTTYYSKLTEAWEAAKEAKTATVTLLKDVTLTEQSKEVEVGEGENGEPVMGAIYYGLIAETGEDITLTSEAGKKCAIRLDVSEQKNSEDEYIYGAMALYCESGTLTIRSCEISVAGESSYGVFGGDATVTIENSAIQASGGDASGVYITSYQSGAALNMRSSTVKADYTAVEVRKESDAGANVGATANIEGCTLQVDGERNVDGVYGQGADLTIKDSTITAKATAVFDSWSNAMESDIYGANVSGGTITVEDSDITATAKTVDSSTRNQVYGVYLSQGGTSDETAQAAIVSGTITATAQAGSAYGVYGTGVVVPTIQGGTVTAQGGTCGVGVYISYDSALQVSGGTFDGRCTSTGEANAEGHGLYVDSSKEISLSGGSFQGNLAAIEVDNTYAQPPRTLGEFLTHTNESHYAYYKENTQLTDASSKTKLEGTITVQGSPHSYSSTATPNGDGTHSKICDVCGYGVTEACSYTWTGDSGTCSVCDSTIEVTVSGADHLSYTGTEQKPAVSVEMDGKTLTQDTDYTVSYANNTNAGTATITITGKDNAWSVEKTFAIAKATPTLTAPTAVLDYGQKLSDSTLTGGTATNSGNTVAGTWAWENENTQPTATGKAAVTFTPTDTKNYNTPTSVEADVTVKPSAPKLTLSAPTFQVAGGTVKVTSGVENPYDAELTDGLPTVALTYSIAGVEETTIADGEFEIPSGTAAETAITITAKTEAVAGKYENATATTTVTVTDKTPVEISGVTVADRVYDGQPSAYSGTPVVKTLDGEPVEGVTPSFVWSSADAAAPVNAGEYTLTISVEDDTHIGSTTLPFTIEKATVTIKADNKTATVGDAQPELTYTATGLASGEELATEPDLTCDADMNTAGDYPITASGAAVPDTGNYNEAITYESGSLTVSAKTVPPSTGSGNGGGTTQPQPTPPSVSTGTTTEDGTTTTETTAKPSATTQGSTATTTVDASMGAEIVKQAVDNGSEAVVIAPEVSGTVNKTEVSIPAATVGEIASQTSADLTVSTPVADVTIPNGGLGSLGSAGGTVTVAAEKSGNTVELSVTANGQKVDSIPGGVTLTVPVEDTTAGTVAVLVREDGTREVVRKSVADDSSVTIPLDGSAKLEIVDNSKRFDDVASDNWAAEAIAFASAHELFNGTSPTQFSPDLSMSRGMLAVVLHNLESNPDQTITGVFADVGKDAWYAEGIAWAAAKGIVTGYSENQFGPEDDITREQLAVMFWRYAGSPAPTGQSLPFTDAGEASSYALEALRWATEQGIVNGHANGQLDPKGLATRAQVTQMLKNFMER